MAKIFARYWGYDVLMCDTSVQIVCVIGKRTMAEQNNVFLAQ